MNAVPRLVAVAFCIFDLASHASAAEVDVSFAGTLFSTGYDQTGIFGLGSSPTSYTGSGIPYQANFAFDTSLGISSSSPTQNSVYGGTNSGVSDPLASASVTINGATVSLPGLYASEISECSTCNSGSGELYVSVEDMSDNGSTTTTNTTSIAIFGAFPGSITSGAYSSSSGLSGVAHISLVTTADNMNFGTSVDTNFEAIMTSASTSVSATPLPATWSLMSVGLAGFGVIARWRRKKRGSGACFTTIA